ncbi:protein CEBPZOS [Schistocerca piceifrons]|uniref:protein CEBPZOS n=1 Tax=Schistocerca piceifrons TaxID=274613 RepID=UPI001F5EAFA4|nr:protein CEBPZOS [Schistocerca piceifrons]XP_047119958.1 protein CEBPZOS [Schistocerca piceifrons]XP_049940043.1 protein CEBPZOS [Schistocerca serialis cubense]XP_049940044.1 protein CEBPZOS [Schistocerca serialis cubense]
MIVKHPKPAGRKYIRSATKILLVAEAIAFAGTYAAWYRMNTSRDFRLYMYHNFNWALEGFYRTGEYLGSSNIRDIDMSVWIQEGKVRKVEK